MWDDKVFEEINQETDNVREGFSNKQLIPNHPNIKKWKFDLAISSLHKIKTIVWTEDR